MSTEKRQFLRKRVNYPARIARDRDSAQVTCAVWDISEGGARLMVDVGLDVPPEFMLLLSGNGRVHRRCRLVWRSDYHVGVQFLPPGAMSDAPRAAAAPVGHTVHLD